MLSSNCPAQINSCIALQKKNPYISYRSIVVYNLSIGTVLILVLTPLLIYILYQIGRIFYDYLSQLYHKYTKFLEAKGVYRSNGSNVAQDNETYSDPIKENADKKYYDDTSYDSITNEINKNISYHTEISKDRLSKNEAYFKSQGYTEELDKIDETALLKENDNWCTTADDTKEP
jgi:hypothetical protein